MVRYPLFDLQQCEMLFLQNQLAPSPSSLRPSDHEIGGQGAPFFDHEYGGFTVPLTWSVRLQPGTYTIKVVIQDVNDGSVDSALLIPENGIWLNTAVIVPGDCNLDGEVDQAGKDAVLLNWEETVDPWEDGDCTGDGYVDQDDLDKVNSHWGDYEWKADFDRDGDVDGDDYLDWLIFTGLDECALKRHGDADGDGDVDTDDYDIWDTENGSSY